VSTTADAHPTRTRHRWLLDHFTAEELDALAGPVTDAQQHLLDGFLERHHITGPDDPDFATKLGIQADNPVTKLALLAIDDDGRSKDPGAVAFLAAVARGEATR
jgi:hypothetical protein